MSPRLLNKTNNLNRLRQSRIIHAVWIVTVILLGLASRSGSPFIPLIIKEYAGDALWALAAYLMIAFLFPHFSIRKVAVIAGLFSLTIEVSQLYHAPWLHYIRRLRLGGFVLGYGFLWSDLVCYAVGIGIGMLLEWSRNLDVFLARKAK